MRRPRAHQGLTLLELMVVLAVVAVLGSLALPSWSGTLQRHRLIGAAEALAADLSEARFESARRGLPLFVQATPGAAGDWCWVVATTPDCPCGSADTCQLKTVAAADHAGLRLNKAMQARLDPGGGALPSAGQDTEFESTQGDRLRVTLGPLGRARICSPGATATRYPRC